TPVHTRARLRNRRMKEVAVWTRGHSKPTESAGPAQTAVHQWCRHGICAVYGLVVFPPLSSPLAKTQSLLQGRNLLSDSGHQVRVPRNYPESIRYAQAQKIKGRGPVRPRRNRIFPRNDYCCFRYSLSNHSAADTST